MSPIEAATGEDGPPGRCRARKPGRAEAGDREAQERISWSPSLDLLSMSEVWLMMGCDLL